MKYVLFGVALGLVVSACEGLVGPQGLPGRGEQGFTGRARSSRRDCTSRTPGASTYFLNTFSDHTDISGWAYRVTSTIRKIVDGRFYIEPNRASLERKAWNPQKKTTGIVGKAVRAFYPWRS